MTTDRTTLPPNNNKALPRDGAQSARRTLYRHPTDKRLAGVCGGIGDYFNIDPVLIRLIWVIATLATAGAGLLAYALLWLLLPVGTQAKGQLAPASIPLKGSNISWVGWALIGAGLIWLLANLGIFPSLWNGFWRIAGILFWPALLIGLGVLMLRQYNQGRNLTQEMKDRMPSGEAVKSGVQSARQRIPLKRTKDDRILLGVCSGIARSVGIDSAIVRILWALFSLGSLGTGVVIYVLLAIILPEDETTIHEPDAIDVVDVDVLDPIS